jgi:hypothetical protein
MQTDKVPAETSGFDFFDGAVLAEDLDAAALLQYSKTIYNFL